MQHKHHKIPKHFFKNYPELVPEGLKQEDPSNIIYLTIEEHAEEHRKLFEQYGKKEDELAWKGLSGQISQEEILEELYVLNGIRWGKSNIGKIPWNKGKKGVQKFTDETKLKMSINRKGKNKPLGFGIKISNALKDKTKSTLHKDNLRQSIINNNNFYILTPKGQYNSYIESQEAFPEYNYHQIIRFCRKEKNGFKKIIKS